MDIDYTLDLGGEKVEITYNDSETRSKEQLNRLKAYYIRFLQNSINTSGDPKKAELLKKIGNSLSDEGTIDIIGKISNDEGKKETVEAVKELLEAYSDEDTDNYIDEEINGNNFEYPKGYDIESVRDELFEIGNHEKGNSWRIETDKDGKVVLSK